jgi:16S rRNA (guanine527-N7)-methyltransferase
MESAPAAFSAAAESVFGDRFPVAERFSYLLASRGVERGLIGPREVPRLWERHLLNCAVVQELIPAGSSVIDVGSGAGLPGVVLAIARPDLKVTLLEPLARRVQFLDEVLEELSLVNATILRGRAEEVRGRLEAPVVTARAVAPLGRLAGWCLPLCAQGGVFLAMKGSSAQKEVEENRGAIKRSGGETPTIVHCGETLLSSPVTVVAIRRRPLITDPDVEERRSRPRR